MGPAPAGATPALQERAVARIQACHRRGGAGCPGARSQAPFAVSWLLARQARVDEVTPAPVEVGSHWLMFAGGFVPWIHVDDHPEDDVYALHFRVSLPASIEAFVHARVPAAERIELCHDERRVVVHRGWTRVAEGCVPEPGDRVIELD